MPTNDEAATSGQDDACECVGCRVFRALWPDGKSDLHGKDAHLAVNAMGSYVAQIIVSECSDPVAAGRKFVERFSDEMIDLIEERTIAAVFTPKSATQH